MPFDATRPNPNGVEFDCLCLDMNGLVHPYAVTPKGERPKTGMTCAWQFFVSSTEYLRLCDRASSFYGARRCGTACKAKPATFETFQSSARSEEEAEEDKEKLRNDFLKMGKVPPPRKKASWDHNVITPGTSFMDTLSKYLRFYIHTRLTHNPAWKDVTIIFSDSNTPGEGEHKIMEFIRLQRVKPGYDPNLKHVIHGLDADLIMLVVLNTKPIFHFKKVIFGGKRTERRVMRTALAKKAIAAGTTNSITDTFDNHDDLISDQKPLEILSVSILREYLAHEFRNDAFSSPFAFSMNSKGVVDDFVFLCFFVGNDFLPHLPSAGYKGRRARLVDGSL